jgi:methylase of polypeptide subunit release factors
MKPPRLGTPAEFAALRALLAGADFTVPGVCQRVGIDSIYDFRSRREGRSGGLEIEDPLGMLIRLFMDVELVDRATLEGLFAPDEIALLESLGLLTSYESDLALRHAAVLLYPSEGLWIASDLNVSPDGPTATVLLEDAVYPAITKNTRQFLAFLPCSPCGSLLELCAGTGIAALVATRYSDRTWAADITERATHFAQFNAGLNDIRNCTAVRGDLYEAVRGLRFDRIVAHPPYMPALEQKYVFRDGGEDGEQITRRILSGLPDHLVPGGRLYCTCMLSDRSEARAEDRVRRMLGERADEFDVLVVSLQAFQPTEYYFRLALAGRATLEEAAQRHEIFTRLGVEHLVYCSFVVERHADPCPPSTARRQAGLASGAEDVEWLMAWQKSVAALDTVALLAAPLRVPEGVRVRLSHKMVDGRWMEEECTLTTGAPFALEAKCPTWVATLVARADGSVPAGQHLAGLKEEGAIPREVAEAELAKLIQSLVAGGFLEVPQHRLPGKPVSAGLATS